MPSIHLSSLAIPDGQARETTNYLGEEMKEFIERVLKSESIKIDTGDEEFDYQEVKKVGNVDKHLEVTCSNTVVVRIPWAIIKGIVVTKEKE